MAATFCTPGSSASFACTRAKKSTTDWAILILGVWQHEPEGDEAAAVETGVDAHQVPETAQQQAGANDQHDGQRHF